METLTLSNPNVHPRAGGGKIGVQRERDSEVVLGREREREREGMADQDSVVEEIAKLNVDQLRQVKEQVESELSVLQDSLVNIRTAATRFEMASKALNTLSLQPAGMSIHPLSHSRLVLLAISGFELSLLRFL